MTHSAPAPWRSNSSTTGSVTTAYNAYTTLGGYTQVTDQAGRLRRSLVDGLGRLVRLDEPNSSNSLGNITSPTQATSYSYDGLSNLTQVVQGSQTRTFNYSSLSRLNSASNPESGTTSYLYDNKGNVTQKTDARNTVINYAYNNLNQLTSEMYTEGGQTANTPDVTYTYGLVGTPCAASYSVGRLCSVSSSVSTTTIDEYDPLGRVMGRTESIDGQNYQLNYSYDRAGHLTSETYPSGEIAGNWGQTTNFGRRRIGYPEHGTSIENRYSGIGPSCHSAGQPQGGCD